MTEGSEFESQLGQVFHFCVLSGVQPPVQWAPEALSPGVKQQGCEADYSPPTSAQVKKTWIYTSTPPYVFMA
jgi:hypothetical protein